MRVLIVGAGALGKCMVGLLAAHSSIMIYERDPKTRRALMQGHLIFKEAKRVRKMIVHAITSLDELKNEKMDALIFATKISDLRAAAGEAAALKPRYVFFPQNGIFEYHWAKRFFRTAHICRGVTTMACQETGLDQVTLFYRGQIHVGGDGASFVAGLFRKGEVMVKTHVNSDGAVWAKLIFSAVMNVLPVITGQGYRVLKEDKEIWRLVKQAVSEGKAVAKARHIRLAFDPMKLIHRVHSGDLSGIKHRGSMVTDSNAGRSTELDFITGALIHYAREERVKTPALDLILSRAREAGA